MSLSPSSTVPASQDPRGQEVLAAQVRLLYANANLGVLVTMVAVTTLACLQWRTISPAVVFGWWLYMAAVSVGRYALARRYRLTSPGQDQVHKWLTGFAVGAGMAGFGWGAAGVLLYRESQLANQLFLVFLLGGMMLGAASLLAPRHEAFLAFLIPAGLGPVIRLLFHGDGTHMAMGLMAAVFTIALLVTTSRIHGTVESSLRLRFENRDLVMDLRAAKHQTEALNQELEQRVQERTAELSKSTGQLRAEIAQRERMEEELLRARKLESLGVLAGGIAHDFNNFLTIVSGNVEMAKAHLDPENPVQENLDQTADACKRATFLSSQLLTFAKGGAPVLRVVSVVKLVMDAVHLARAGAPTGISVSIAEDIWFARVDPGQIGQVLHNILLNARQAMPLGGIVEVRAENLRCGTPDGCRVRISIRDYGCGIPSDVLPRIFDPYFTTKLAGNGLGLATSYAIVAKHGGHISVESHAGVGSVFHVDLPASQEGPAHTAPAAGHLERGTERILAMDDDPAVRNLLNAVLSSLGYDVQVAADGAEAVALYEAASAAGRRFDAVLLDLTVCGGMGGVETAAKLKELHPAAKLIVSSGYADAPVMADFAAYGFAGVIPKPWSSKELSEVFRRVLVGQPERKTD